MATNPQSNVDNELPVEGEIVDAPDLGTLAVLNKSEINQQIATARQFPRMVSRFRKEATELVTLDKETALECIYALPRDGKMIEGPSARFAEIISYSWGNTRAGSRVVSEGEEFITSQGMFYDLEKNTAICYEVQRRITDKNGRRFKPDMIAGTANAACSIALRNAILKGIPKAIWRPIYLKARTVIAGDAQTLSVRRDEAMKQFGVYGITPQQIYATLGVGGVADITIDHLVQLFGILTAIKEGDTTPEQAFAVSSTADVRTAKGTASAAENLANKYAPKSSEGSNEAGASVVSNPPLAQGDAKDQALSRPPQAHPSAPQPSNQEPSQPGVEARQDESQPTPKQEQHRSAKAHGEPLDFGSKKSK